MRTHSCMNLTLYVGAVLCAVASVKADVVDFVANLTPECAQTTSTASGTGVFSLNTQTGLFTWHIVQNVENATFAHIHGPIAQACGSLGGGAIQIDIGPTSPADGTRVLNATKQQELLAGLYYVNVHSDAFVSGEISGVIVRAPEVNKCRHISFIPGHPGVSTAIRVRLTSLHHVNPPYAGGPSVPFTSFEGEERWVGPPVQYVESSSTGITYHASSLQCTPHYQDWGSILTLHVNGSAIVPSSIYDVEVLDSSCLGNESGCAAILDSYTINTTRWGDVETPYNPPSPTTQPDLSDIAGLVNKFKSVPGAPIKARGLIAGVDAVGTIDSSLDLNLAHISVCVDAFKGKPYPYVIGACP